MSEVESLLRAYQRFVRLPWDTNLAGPQKVWYVVYSPAQERRLRLQLPAFEHATRDARHGWTLIDLKDRFGQWMGAQEYRDAYFEQPELMEVALEAFADDTVRVVREALRTPEATLTSVVAIVGLASLFGLMRVSPLIERVANDIRGRLVLFFPGEYELTNYRLLDARDGTSYLGVPITATTES